MTHRGAYLTERSVKTKTTARTAAAARRENVRVERFKRRWHLSGKRRVCGSEIELGSVVRPMPRVGNGIARRRALLGVVSFAARAQVTRLVRAAEHGCEEGHEHE